MAAGSGWLRAADRIAARRPAIGLPRTVDRSVDWFAAENFFSFPPLEIRLSSLYH